MTRLQNDQPFPTFNVPAGSGRTINIPQSLQGSYGVVLIYRGAWCPYCQAQLAYLKSKAQVPARRSRQANEAGALLDG